MQAVRLIPVFLSILIFAAHVLRGGHLYSAVLILLLMATLFIRHPLVMRVWQGFLVFIGLLWVKITIGLVHLRMATGTPWLRMVFILGTVAFVAWISAWLLGRGNSKRFYTENKNRD